MTKSIYLFVLTFLSTCLIAQTNTFVGSSPGAWHEARNWSLKQIPTSAHDVVIQDKSVIIEEYESGVAKSVYIDPTSYFETENNTSLSIANSSSIGLHNQGRVSIGGRLLVQDVAGSSSFNDHCIWNEGFFFVSAGGWVYLEDSGGCGLTVDRKGEYYNHGELWVYDTNYGIRVRGKMENHDYIYLEPSQSHGLECRGGLFTNKANSTLRIEGSHFGVLLFEDPAVPGVGRFDNHGVVRAERMEWWGVSASDGTFNNYKGAQVKCMYSQFGSGVSIGPDGRFNNYSSIETRYNELDGVFMQGEFFNYGNLFASHNGRHGLFLLTVSGFSQPGTFENYNDVEIFDNDSTSIHCSQGFYLNTDKGITVHYNKLRGDSIRNDGIWESFAPDLVHTATMSNHGVILDYYDAHGLTTNHQLIVDPVDGPLVQGVSINNALELVSTSNISIFRWYKRFYGGPRIGTYNVGLNRFTPNAQGDGEDHVYVDVRINSSGQRRRIMAMVDETSPLRRNEILEEDCDIPYQVPSTQEGDCIVYSTNGVIWQRGSKQDGIPNWTQLPPGLYTCSCQTKGGTPSVQHRWVR